MSEGVALTDADREPWLKSILQSISAHIEKDKSAVFACSALKKCYRDLLRVNKDVKFVMMHGPSELLASRLHNRKGHFFHPKLLENQLKILELPTDEADALMLDIPFKDVKSVCDLIIDSFHPQMSSG